LAENIDLPQYRLLPESVKPLSFRKDKSSNQNQLKFLKIVGKLNKSAQSNIFFIYQIVTNYFNKLHKKSSVNFTPSNESKFYK